MKAGRARGLSPAGFHDIAYVAWGDESAARPPVLCCHGLTRNGRDFDILAKALAADRFVFAPDMVGRGRSDWLRDPQHYAYPQYLADMNAVLQLLPDREVDWVGTSMGGLIGMMLAALPGSPIRRLVINDIGPFVPQAALTRIAGYVGRDESFADLAELEAQLRRNHAPFGPLSDAQWRHLAEHSHRRRADGRLALAYDPAIAVNLRLALRDWDLWEIWEKVNCPVLVLRGADSDLLLPETAARMMQSGADLSVFPGIGHAPALMAEDQIALVKAWLDRD